MENTALLHAKLDKRKILVNILNVIIAFGVIVFISSLVGLTSYQDEIVYKRTSIAVKAYQLLDAGSTLFLLVIILLSIFLLYLLNNKLLNLTYILYVLSFIIIINICSFISFINNLFFIKKVHLLVWNIWLIVEGTIVNSMILLFLIVSLIIIFIIQLKPLNKQNRMNLPQKHELHISYMVLVTFAVVTTSLLYTAPFSPILNPERYPVNVDWLYYYMMLHNIDRLGFLDATVMSIKSLLSGADFRVSDAVPVLPDRLGYIAYLYLLGKAGINPYTLSVLGALPFIALLPIAYLLFSLSDGFERREALAASLLFPVSPQMLGFIYGGFQAQVASLSLFLVGYALLALDSKRARILGLLTLITAFSMHIYATLFYATILLLYQSKHRAKRLITLISLITVLLVVILLATPNLLRVTSHMSISAFPVAIVAVSRYYLWGVLGSTFFYSLVLIGVLASPYTFTNFLAGAASIIMLLGDAPLLARMLVSLPLLPLAGKGLTTVFNNVNVGFPATMLIMSFLTYNTIYFIVNSVP